MGVKRWTILVTPTAKKQLSLITEHRIRQIILSTLKRLEYEPEKQGKPMVGELSGCRSLRAVGQRYRIIYRLKNNEVQVYVVFVGKRKEGDKTDVYALAKKLVRLGLLGE